MICVRRPRGNVILLSSLGLGLILLFFWCPVTADAQSDAGSEAANAPTADEDVETYELKFSRGLVEFGRGNYEAAEIYFDLALEGKPGDPEASYYLGQALLRQSKLEDAEDVFRDMVEANPESGKAWLGIGMVQYNRGEYQEALTSLAAAEKLMPTDALVYYFQGLAYHDLQDFDKSPGRFLRAMTLSPDLAPTAQYYSGVAFFKRGAMDEAKTSFESAIAAGGDTEQVRISKELLTQTVSQMPAGPRKWSASFNLAAEYDTNVVVLPSGTSPPAGSTGISRQKDYRTVMNANLEYRAIQTDTWTIGSTMGVYQSFHRTLSGFDVEDFNPTFYIRRQIGPVQATASYLYNYTLVGRSPYLIAHTAQTTFSVTETPWTFTQVAFRFQNKDFQDGRFLLNSARDGKNWLAGLTQYLLFAENQGRFRLGYTYDTDNTGGGSPDVAALPGTAENADWDYIGHRFSVGLELPPIYTVEADLAFDFYRQNYENPNTLSANGLIKRRDNIYAFTGALTREVNKYFALSLQYAYTRDENNIQAYDYNRSIYSLILNGTF
ncbi:MAG: tetratricopeptide repeat protein [Nitrospirae bacterium]|nr:MAG: tetratricopeptide repeat protein [Nitrospirota bacterium]